MVHSLQDPGQAGTSTQPCLPPSRGLGHGASVLWRLGALVSGFESTVLTARLSVWGPHLDAPSQPATPVLLSNTSVTKLGARRASARRASACRVSACRVSVQRASACRVSAWRVRAMFYEAP